jgi:hypothetical protein
MGAGARSAEPSDSLQPERRIFLTLQISYNILIYINIIVTLIIKYTVGHPDDEVALGAAVGGLITRHAKSPSKKVVGRGSLAALVCAVVVHPAHT